VQDEWRNATVSNLGLCIYHKMTISINDDEASHDNGGSITKQLHEIHHLL
jgi:hypothetical protein